MSPYFDHPSENISRLQQKSVIVHHSLALLCPAIGLPKPKLNWFYNGREIHLDRRKHLQIKQNGKKLLITKIQVEKKNKLKKFSVHSPMKIKI